MFTALTLQRITSTDATPAESTEEDISTPSESLQEQDDLSIDAMKELIVNESEVVDVHQSVPSHEECKDTLSCIVCFEELNTGSPEYRVAFRCTNAECGASLCVGCLYRQVDVTIRNALYAVPRIRCPGTCMQRISTATWRGALNGVEIPSDEPPTDRKPIQELVNAIVQHADAFLGRTEGTCLHDLCELYDAVAALLKDKQLSFCDVYSAAYELGIIPTAGTEAVSGGAGEGAVEAAPEVPEAGEDRTGSSDLAAADGDACSTSNVSGGGLSEEVRVEEAARAPASAPVSTPSSAPHLVIPTFSIFSQLVFPQSLPTEVLTPEDASPFDATEVAECLHSSVLSLGFTESDVPAEVVRNVMCHFMATLAVCLRPHGGLIERLEAELRRKRSLDASSAENSLMKRYAENAEALMAMRCGGCDGMDCIYS